MRRFTVAHVMGISISRPLMAMLGGSILLCLPKDRHPQLFADARCGVSFQKPFLSRFPQRVLFSYMARSLSGALSSRRLDAVTERAVMFSKENSLGSRPLLDILHENLRARNLVNWMEPSIRELQEEILSSLFCGEYPLERRQSRRFKHSF